MTMSAALDPIHFVLRKRKDTQPSRFIHLSVTLSKNRLVSPFERPILREAIMGSFQHFIPLSFLFGRKALQIWAERNLFSQLPSAASKSLMSFTMDLHLQQVSPMVTWLHQRSKTLCPLLGHERLPSRTPFWLGYPWPAH